ELPNRSRLSRSPEMLPAQVKLLFRAIASVAVVVAEEFVTEPPVNGRLLPSCVRIARAWLPPLRSRLAPTLIFVTWPLGAVATPVLTGAGVHGVKRVFCKAASLSEPPLIVVCPM